MTKILASSGHDYSDCRQLADLHVQYPSPKSHRYSTSQSVIDLHSLDGSLFMLRLVAENARVATAVFRLFDDHMSVP